MGIEERGVLHSSEFCTSWRIAYVEKLFQNKGCLHWCYRRRQHRREKYGLRDKQHIRFLLKIYQRSSVIESQDLTHCRFLKHLRSFRIIKSYKDFAL